MKVQNMTSDKGNKIANQFIIKDEVLFTNGEGQEKIGFIEVFQSYETVIVKILHKGWKTETFLDNNKWDYSRTTGKYRNLFLGETKKETEKKIASGEYILTNLN